MEKRIKYIGYLCIAMFALCFGSCADEIAGRQESKEGTLLNLYAEVEGQASTRLAELPHNQIGTEAGTKNYKDVGLYIYYEDDYNGNDLSKPYIRNLHMTYKDGKLVSADDTNQEIYIYDRMTIVAMYPYNKGAKDFTIKADEESYYISESDYVQQKYIPYRAETNVNPTNAYTTRLYFRPKQTCKVQIVLTANDESLFPKYEEDENKKPANEASITILPDVDPVVAEYKSGEDRREQWIDSYQEFPAPNPTASGKYVRRYTAYIWTTGKDIPHHDNNPHSDNIIEKGAILFKSEKLTLTVPATVNLAEQKVYRYGYDLSSGEIFIPTSESLVYDAATLKAPTFSDNRAYQVCDINLSSETSWAPLNLYGNTYDGGGHAIKGLKIDATMTSTTGDTPKSQSFGLFGTVTSGGASKLMNIHLVAPEITVNGAASTDTCYVGALCGLLNEELSLEERRDKIIAGLPPELSQTVKEALADEALKDGAAVTTCTIEGCKVENPKISVSNVQVPVVGGFCGGVGNQTQIGNITDSYLAQTDDKNSYIRVNSGDTDWQAATETPRVGSFCGLLAKGTIKNSYTTMSKNVTASFSTTASNAQTQTEAAANFGYQLTAAKENAKVTDCYTSMDAIATGANPKGAKAATATLFSTSFPTSWPLFTSQNNKPFYKWPCVSWENYWANQGTAPSTYPTLMWEEKPYFTYDDPTK